jgi:hypothetical protein
MDTRGNLLRFCVSSHQVIRIRHVWAKFVEFASGFEASSIRRTNFIQREAGIVVSTREKNSDTWLCPGRPRDSSKFLMILKFQRDTPTKRHTHTHTHSQKALARGDWIRLTSLRRELLNSVLCEGIAEGKGISEENSWMSSQWRIGVSLEICFCRGEYRKLGEIST